MDLKNVLEVYNQIFVLPVAVISFILLIKVALFLRIKDPDVVRAKIFLKYRIFRKAVVLTAVFAFVLVIHIFLIYVPHFFNSTFGLPLADIQRLFGLVLVFTLITFVYFIYRSIK